MGMGLLEGLLQGESVCGHVLLLAMFVASVECLGMFGCHFWFGVAGGM